MSPSAQGEARSQTNESTLCTLLMSNLELQSKALEAARAALEAKRQQSPAEPRSGHFQYSSNRHESFDTTHGTPEAVESCLESVSTR